VTRNTRTPPNTPKTRNIPNARDTRKTRNTPNVSDAPNTRKTSNVRNTADFRDSPLDPVLERFLARLGIRLSPKQKKLLARYRDMLVDASQRINLVSSGDRGRLDTLHFADSLGASGLVPQGAAVADWGSGGGLPGVPLAIARPDIRMTLVEARRKKAAFLLRVVRELGVGNLRLFPDRGENLKERFELVTVRAVGKIKVLLPTLIEHLTAKGAVLFYKGPGLEDELDPVFLAKLGFGHKTQTVILPSGVERRYLLLQRL